MNTPADTTTATMITTAPAPVLPFPSAEVLPFPRTAAALRDYRRLSAHAAAQERHFIQRTRERYGFTLSRQRYRYWIEKVEQVLDGTEFVHATEMPERTVWRIRSGSYLLHVVYDETTARLVTCFPPPFAPVPIKRLHRRRRAGRAGRAAKTCAPAAGTAPVVA